MTWLHVEAPTEWDGPGHAIFLAGGITDCPDWQAEARAQAKHATLLNPRRENFPIDDPSAAEEQIAWEFRHLHRASVVLFWFSPGPSPQPIALYELGRHAALNRRIVVGAHPDYLRVTDVHEQLRHARPEVKVYDTLEHTVIEAVFQARILDAADAVEADPSEMYRTIEPLAGMFWPRVEAGITAELRRRGSTALDEKP